MQVSNSDEKNEQYKRTQYLLQVSINCGGHGDGTAISPRGHSGESVVPVMHYDAQELLSYMNFFFLSSIFSVIKALFTWSWGTPGR